MNPYIILYVEDAAEVREIEIMEAQRTKSGKFIG